MALLNDLPHWQHRALEMRRLAATERDPALREVMERCALDYDRMAERAGTHGALAAFLVTNETARGS